MTKAILGLAATLLFAGSATLGAGAQSAPAGARVATLTVDGQASVTRAPDRATVSFRIETNGDQSAAAASANQTIANALAKRLAALNIPATAITTVGYGLTYVPRPPKPDPASTQRYGFTVERTVDVALDDVEGAGAAIDAGVAAGVTSVDGVAFALRDPRAALRSAQAAALADAMAQARGLAAAAHVRLVRILTIAPAGNAPAPQLLRFAAAAAPTTIAPGDLTVSATVVLRYEIAPDAH
jgi:uncharacterized protein YggE